MNENNGTIRHSRICHEDVKRKSMVEVLKGRISDPGWACGTTKRKQKIIMESARREANFRTSLNY